METRRGDKKGRPEGEKERGHLKGEQLGGDQKEKTTIGSPHRGDIRGRLDGAVQRITQEVETKSGDQKGRSEGGHQNVETRRGDK